jgi:hypothetical protein
MQFGSSPRVCRFGFVFLFTVFGTLTSSAQLDQFGQGLGGQLGQQPSCDPNDPTCQSSDQGNFQTRSPSSNQQQQTLTPQIIVPGQDTTQTNTQNNLQNQQQNQNQLTRLPLDSPTAADLWSKPVSKSAFHVCTGQFSSGYARLCRRAWGRINHPDVGSGHA